MTDFLQVVGEQQSAITAIATVIIAFAAIVSAVLTIVLVRENRILRKAGTYPKVIAYLLPDHTHKTVLNFILANIGEGPALDVSFAFEENNLDFSNHNVEIQNSPSRSAVAVLPQSERITTFFGMGPDLYKEPRLKPFKVVVKYKSTDQTSHKDDYLLDISQFEGLVSVGTPSEYEIAKALKSIEQNIAHFASGFKRLKVETISTNQVKKEQQEWKNKRLSEKSE
jgi:hypothetical protein